MAIFVDDCGRDDRPTHRVPSLLSEQPIRDTLLYESFTPQATHAECSVIRFTALKRDFEEPFISSGVSGNILLRTTHTDAVLYESQVISLEDKDFCRDNVQPAVNRQPGYRRGDS